ncbi:unnamed protein product, partial [Nesidiocoris tenuis]
MLMVLMESVFGEWQAIERPRSGPICRSTNNLPKFHMLKPPNCKVINLSIASSRMKWDKPLWVWLLILIAIALVKASVRLIILLVLGLAGLYMLHLLAQDFNKIRNGWPFPARPGMGGAQSFLRLSRGLSKRSTDVQAYNYTADVQ